MAREQVQTNYAPPRECELMLCCFARKQRCGVEAAAAPNVTYASRTHASSRASRRPTAPNRSAARSRISVLLLAA